MNLQKLMNLQKSMNLRVLYVPLGGRFVCSSREDPLVLGKPGDSRPISMFLSGADLYVPLGTRNAELRNAQCQKIGAGGRVAHSGRAPEIGGGVLHIAAGVPTSMIPEPLYWEREPRIFGKPACPAVPAKPARVLHSAGIRCGDSSRPSLTRGGQADCGNSLR